MPDQGEQTDNQKDGWLHRSSKSEVQFATRAVIAVTITLASILALLFLWFAIDVLLLFFGSVLLAVFFHALADLLVSYTRLHYRWALGVVILTLLLVLVAGGWFLAPSIAGQLSQLTQTLPQTLKQAESWLSNYQWGQFLLSEAPTSQEAILGRFGVTRQITGAFSTAVAIIGNVFILLALALYLAASPGQYKHGVLTMIPPGKRMRAEEIIHTLGYDLQRWLLGRAASMVIVGVLIGVGLWFLNVPLALALGFLAGLFTFIPYIGPIIGFVPAVLVALSQGPMTGLYVAILYFAVEELESFLLVPIVEKIAVTVPPAMTIASQVLLGVLIGVPGLVVATPLTAVILLLVKMIYVEDLLGDSAHVPGEESNEEQQQRLEREEARRNQRQKEES